MRSSLIIFAALVGTAACSTTKVTSTWTNPEGPANPIKKVLVVGAVRDEAAKRRLEDQLVTELAKKGVTALPSHRFETAGKPLDRDAIKAIAGRERCDSVLVSRYVGTERSLDYVPSVTYYDYLAGPGYYEETENVKLETRLFSADDGHLLWVASTSTVDPTSIESMSEAVAKKIVDTLDKDVTI